MDSNKEGAFCITTCGLRYDGGTSDSRQGAREENKNSVHQQEAVVNANEIRLYRSSDESVWQRGNVSDIGLKQTTYLNTNCMLLINGYFFFCKVTLSNWNGGPMWASM